MNIEVPSDCQSFFRIIVEIHIEQMVPGICPYNHLRYCGNYKQGPGAIYIIVSLVIKRPAYKQYAQGYIRYSKIGQVFKERDIFCGSQVNAVAYSDSPKRPYEQTNQKENKICSQLGFIFVSDNDKKQTQYQNQRNMRQYKHQIDHYLPTGGGLSLFPGKNHSWQIPLKFIFWKD